MCIDPSESSLTVAVDRTITSAVAVDDQHDAGLGWFLDVTKGTVEKSGRIAGYRTFDGFAPQSQVGVVVFAAHDQFPAPELGTQLLHKMMDQK